MQEYQVVTAGGQSPRTALNVAPGTSLTPRLARRASRIATGYESGNTVWNHDGAYGYLLLSRYASRRVEPDPDLMDAYMAGSVYCAECGVALGAGAYVVTDEQDRPLCRACAGDE